MFSSGASSSRRSAERKQLAAVRDAMGSLRLHHFQDMRQLDPFLDASQGAFTNYLDFAAQPADYGELSTDDLPDPVNLDLDNDPVLAFLNDETMRNVSNASAAQGKYNSGGRMAEIADRVHNNTSVRAFDRINQLANLRGQLFDERARQRNHLMQVNNATADRLRHAGELELGLTNEKRNGMANYYNALQGYQTDLGNIQAARRMADAGAKASRMGAIANLAGTAIGTAIGGPIGGAAAGAMGNALNIGV